MNSHRRTWLKAGGASALGCLLSASAVRRPAARGAEGTALARPIDACILIFHYGGPSHLDTYDPKPDAPAEVRGEYANIDTSVPGIRVSEHLPLVAQRMHRLALVRSVHHSMRNHNAAAPEALTGRTPAGGDLELLTEDPRGFPTLGSAVAYGLGERANVLPYVALPYTIYNVVPLPGQSPGLLGGRYERFQVEGNPNDPNFRMAVLDAAPEIRRRRELLLHIDRQAESADSRMAAFRQRALDLVLADGVRHAFDIQREPENVRDRYGRGLLGQSVLLARRLVESGVNFVTVFDGQYNGQDANWDSHEKVFPRHRQLIPPADRALSALIEDLESRGRLDTTLVVSMGEFGRTPRINKSAGRDHWPDCYTVVMAGGGVAGGAIHGASDNIGAYPAVDPVSPGDVASTIHWRFGIDLSHEVHDQTGRPYTLGNGRPLKTLFA